MIETSLINPHCCITGKHCSYDNGFVDGYVIGTTLMFIFLALIECVCSWNRACFRAKYIRVESDDESDNIKTNSAKKDD